MRIAILGAGPAGLYLSYLIKRRGADVTVIEQNPPDATFGFGVVFSDRALEFLREDDEETYAAIVPHMEAWDDMTLNLKGERVVIDGIGFSAVGRLHLLQLLQARAASVGVAPVYRRVVKDLAELADFDLVVGADGVNSLVRRTHAAALGASVGHLTNRFAWFGTGKSFETLTQTFIETEAGRVQRPSLPLFAGHEHLHRRDERRHLQRMGFAALDEAATRERCERLFAATLDGHRADLEQFDLAPVPDRAQCAMVARQICAARRRVAHRAFLHRFRHPAGDGGRHRARQGARRAQRRAGGAGRLRGGAPSDPGEAGGRRQRQRRLVRAFRRAHGA